MTILDQPELKQEFSKWKPDHLLEIIDKLAGGKSSLRVDVQDIKLTINDKQYELAGKVDFVIHGKKNGSFSSVRPAKVPEKQGERIRPFKSSKVLIFTGDLEVLNIDVAGKCVNIDVEDKEFIKRVMKLRNELTPKNSESLEKKSNKKSDPLAMIRTIAETSKKLGITLTLSYKGHRIATLGAEANPTLLQLATKTRALSLNSICSAIRMML
jgi:hypothetical protein